MALTLDSVELMARGLEAFDDSGTDLSNPASTSCTEEKKWDLGEEIVDAYASVRASVEKMFISRQSSIPEKFPAYGKIKNFNMGL